MHALSTWDQTRTRFAVRILNRCGGWLGQGASYRGQLSAARMMQAARRRCDYADSDPGEIIEPLSRLLRSCEEEAHLNFVGKMALRSDVMRNLGVRLTLQRAREREPQIAQEEIREPLFIVGLPRSGTTLLHSLLACDPAHRVPLTWEALDPSPPASPRAEKAQVQRAANCLRALEWLAPTFRQVHAIGADLPQECVGLMSPTFLSDQWDTMFYVPSYRDWFLQQDMRPVYRFHRRFLQHLQKRRKASRLVLKAPAHMTSAAALLEVYPDALFVQTHRDPIEAVSSVSSLIAILRSIFSDQVDPRQIGHDALEYWSQSIATFLRTREKLPSRRVCDISYADVRRDPMAAVRCLYSHFGWLLSSEAERRMRLHLAQRPHQQHGRHIYHARQFGLEESDAVLFAEYCRRFHLPLQREAEERAA